MGSCPGTRLALAFTETHADDVTIESAVVGAVTYRCAPEGTGVHISHVPVEGLYAVRSSDIVVIYLSVHVHV